MNIKKILQTAGKSCTKEREAIFNFMKKKHIFFALDLENNFSTISRASIFRSVKLFLELGIVRRVPLGERGEGYELVQEDNHHEHFNCQKCGGILEVHSEKICSAIFEAAAKMKFEIKEHNIGVFGICENCG